MFQASGGSLTQLIQLLREWNASGALEAHRFTLYCSPPAAEALRSMLDGQTTSRVRLEVEPLAGRGLVARLRAEQWLLRRRLEADAIDVLFCPANVMPYSSRVPCVVMFQNAAPFCSSVNWRTLRSPGWWLRFRLLGLFLRMSAKRASRVVFISKWFRDLVVTRLAMPPERGVVVLPPAIEPSASRDPVLERSLGIDSPYVLYVSHLNPYKNMLEVIDAFLSSDSRAAGRQLVICGITNFPWYREAMKARISGAGAGRRVILTGGIPHGEVERLLAGAEAFVFASTCENPSIALIEAMSYGLPIACSKVGVMPETAGDAAVFFDPEKPHEIAAAIAAVLHDQRLRADLRRRGALRVATLPTTRQAAAAILSTILEAGAAR